MSLLARIFSRVIYPVDRLGKAIMTQGYFLIELFEMAYLSVRSALFDYSRSERAVWGEILQQVYFTGWQALPIISALAIISGTAAIAQAASQLTLLGSKSIIGDFLVVIVVRELAPLLTALIIVARSGTAVATHLGNMRANGEIEALESMGIHPLSYVVFPRLMGGVASVVSLTFYFGFVALVGGYAVTAFFNEMDPGFYLESLAQAMEAEDLALFLVKSVFNGLFIFLICSHYGLSVKRSHHEVPRNTTKAVMRSLSYVVFFNIEATLLFYLIKFAVYGWL